MAAELTMVKKQQADLTDMAQTVTITDRPEKAFLSEKPVKEDGASQAEEAAVQKLQEAAAAEADPEVADLANNFGSAQQYGD